jgi:hypothetical protein
MRRVKVFPYVSFIIGLTDNKYMILTECYSLLSEPKIIHLDRLNRPVLSYSY